MRLRSILDFPLVTADEPVVYVLVKRFDLIVNILRAQILPDRGGELLVDLEGPDSALEEGLAYLRGLGVGISPVSRTVTHDADRCVACGGCVSLCPGKALAMGEPDWLLRFDPDRCVACGLCAKACPTRSFRTLW